VVQRYFGSSNLLFKNQQFDPRIKKLSHSRQGREKPAVPMRLGQEIERIIAESPCQPLHRITANRPTKSAISCRRLNLAILGANEKTAILPNPINACSAAPTLVESQLVDTAALDAALTSALVQTGTLMVAFISTNARDAPCRHFSPRWRTANRGVNNLAGSRSMLKMTGFVMGGGHMSALHGAVQCARRVLWMCSSRICSIEMEEALGYVASEARFKGEASKQSCIRAGNRRGIFGSIDRRVGSRYTVAEYGTVSGHHPR
jgi:hypothetical protein